MLKLFGETVRSEKAIKSMFDHYKKSSGFRCDNSSRAEGVFL